MGTCTICVAAVAAKFLLSFLAGYLFVCDNGFVN